LRQGSQARGIFTVEYPEEKLAMPERFRFVPFLVVNNFDDPHAPGHDWCTSCGICAKVCPPQCIWIVRGTDAKTGRPKPEPEAFYIDIDICMNCGYCAEYCPFDAIKMDHDYELASYDRTTAHIFDKKKLSKESRYWQAIAPNRALEEAELRGQWEHKDTLKVAKKAGIPMTSPLWENRDKAVHNPDIERAAAPSAVAATADVPPAAPIAAAPAAVSINVEGASVEQLTTWAGDESLPLAARSAAAVRLDAMIRDKTFKPASEHRKAVSAAKKAATAAGTTIEDAAAGFKPGEAVVAAAPAPAPAAAAQAAPAAAPAVSVAPAAGGDVMAVIEAARELERKGKAKEITLTSADRKRISAAKKLAQENEIEW
jgi:NADH-quinone oxidoreductase subunit I